MAGDPKYLQLLEDMKNLHIKKNAGYSGDSPDRWDNFRESEGFGVTSILGVLVRMGDKWIRIKNLIKNPSNEKVGEAITDTLMDLASYALICICLMNEKSSKVENPPTPIHKNYIVEIMYKRPGTWYEDPDLPTIWNVEVPEMGEPSQPPELAQCGDYWFVREGGRFKLGSWILREDTRLIGYG